MIGDSRRQQPYYRDSWEQSLEKSCADEQKLWIHVFGALRPCSVARWNMDSVYSIVVAGVSAV